MTDVDTLAVPASFTFPFGYHVEIHTLSRTEYKKQWKRLYPNDLPNARPRAMCEDLEGGYRIYLDKSRTLRRLRADLTHEVGHAFLDWQVWLLNGRHADATG